MIEGIEALDQALGIVEAIDPDDEEATAKACHHLPHQWRPHVAARQPLECARLDTDRKIPDPRLLPAHTYGRMLTGDFEYSQFPCLIALGHQVANEVVRIA